MKIFSCDHCGSPAFFDNDSCLQCGSHLGYLDFNRELISKKGGDNSWNVNGTDYRYCKNHQFGICNWIIPTNEAEFCLACSLNRTIPNLEHRENIEKWRRLEKAKHRLIYQLHRLGLPIISKLKNKEAGLCFDFISNKNLENPVMTGHANGVITILLTEADSVHREQLRKQLSEPYRTLIGHFRHEVGHYYWDVLMKSDNVVLQKYRKLFGDERTDYAEALEAYYSNGAPESWQLSFISEYATAHPWEDWAETWAHYLHIIDTLETAYYFGLSPNPITNAKNILKTTMLFDPYEEPKFQRIIDNCIPVFFAINAINRGMGIPDIYPFVTTKVVVKKMKFIHQLIINAQKRQENA